MGNEGKVSMVWIKILFSKTSKQFTKTLRIQSILETLSSRSEIKCKFRTQNNLDTTLLSFVEELMKFFV